MAPDLFVKIVKSSGLWEKEREGGVFIFSMSHLWEEREKKVELESSSNDLVRRG